MLTVILTLLVTINGHVESSSVKSFKTMNDCQAYVSTSAFESIYDAEADRVDTENVDYECKSSAKK